MKTLVSIVLAMGLSAAALAQGQLEVVVKNVKGATGNIRVGVFKDGATFLKTTLEGQVVKAAAGEVKVIFQNLPAGTYAVSIIHDENENGELDSNLFGMPKEGFGFSNDAMGSFGPPAFEKASFKMESQAKQIAISLRYL